MTYSALQLSFPEPHIAQVTIDVPDKSMNVLSSVVREELCQVLDTLKHRPEIQGLILYSGKPSAFIAGADVKEFSQFINDTSRDIVSLCSRGQELYRRLATAPYVTVAAIHGLCLGGGAELVQWCDARILTNSEKTEFGFPEVKLGLIPAWGGTVRLPRMIGLPNAVSLITSGESVPAQLAKQLGWATEVVAAEQLLSAAMAFIERTHASHAHKNQRQKWSQPVEMASVEQDFLARTSRAKLLTETQGHYPAPLAALELLLNAAFLEENVALNREAQVFASLFGSPVNQALLNLFLLTDRIKKVSIPNSTSVSFDNKLKVGVVGAGIMGAGIATTQVKRQVATCLVDVSSNALSQATQQLFTEIAYDKSTKQTNPQLLAQRAIYLQSGQSLATLADCDFVIEAIAEKLEVKTALYEELENILTKEAILATNTSTLPITKLAEKLRYPQRFCGLHFFNPVRRMPLVEIIRGSQTSTETLAKAVAYVRRLQKFPLVVNDSPGFLVNRILSPYLNAAVEMLSEGIAIAKIDAVATDFGMPLGPFALYDMVGLDTALQAGRVMYESFSSRIVASPVLPALLKARRLGQKNGLGFYRYSTKQPQHPELDPEVSQILGKYVRQTRELTERQIMLRLLMPMLQEAARVLDEKIVSDARDVDTGMIYGLGFPKWRGGLLFWAETLGRSSLEAMCDEYIASGKEETLTQPLRQRLAQGLSFYAK